MKSTFIKYSILQLFLLVALTSFGQNEESILRGKIVDENGMAIHGATVFISELNKGTVTDISGFYKLTGRFDKNYTVSYSFLGYETEIREVNFSVEKNQTIPITLKESTTSLSSVSIIAKSKVRKAREQAYAVNVIKAEELYNTGADMNQVLNNTSGVRVRENGGLGSDFSFSLNGFSGNQVKFFLDGIPIDNFGSSLTLNNFPVSLAETVEVYKGVLPITLGSDALGGAVNIVTRSAPNYLDVSYGYGSFNTHKANVNFAYTAPESGFTTRITAFYNYSDNNYKVDVQPIDLITNQRLPEQEVERFHDTYQSATIHAEVGLVNKPYADKLLIGLIASGNDKDIQTGVTMDQVFGARTAQSSVVIPTVKYYKTDLFKKGLDFKLYAAYNMAKNKFIDTTRVRYNWLQETVPTTSAEFRRTQLENKDKEGLLTSNLSYAINKAHSVSLNYQLTDFDRTSSDVENPDNVTFQFPQHLTKQTLGLAYQIGYSRFNGTIFSKYYILNAQSFSNTSVGGSDPIRKETNLDNFGYGAAATYFVLPKLQAKASLEQTYRLPESVELLGDGLFTRRNPDLKPERSLNFNFGGKYEFAIKSDHVVSIEANYLWRKSEDFIRLDQAQSQPVDRQYVNIGNVDTNGFEADLRYQWSNKLRAGANITYQRIIDKQEFLTSTNLSGTITTPNLNYNYKVPNIPYLFGNFNADYTVFSNSYTTDIGETERVKNRINIGYSLNYVHEYFFTPNQLGANNQDNIPTQLSHNALATYEIDNGKFNISFEVRNITNEDLFDNYLLQNPGRSYFINLRYFLDKPLF
ncbi:TonB-dependent receptor [Bizionia echini]|uniref:TonB-dependent receptor n=1 Tax=Bizionia echini TaxID=649333 RepID=UPI001160B885|nr:TonB-dependent receptor [Bizionia echini]